MLLITGTELLMGGAQVGVETSTLPLPSLQRQSPQSTCFTQLAVGGVCSFPLECLWSAQKQVELESC